MFADRTDLSIHEKSWLNAILACDFQGRQGIIRQLNSASVNREYTKFYLFLKFSVDKRESPTWTNTRVPVEMNAYKKDEVPVQFLLHVVNGYVSLLEIFRGDSSEIDCEFDISDAQLEYVIPQIQ